MKKHMYEIISEASEVTEKFGRSDAQGIRVERNHMGFITDIMIGNLIITTSSWNHTPHIRLFIKK